MFGIRDSQPVLSQEHCQLDASGIIYRKARRRLKLQISKRTLQEWQQDRDARRGFARTAIQKAIRA